MNGEKYLLMLAKQGVKFPDDFDLNELKAPPKKSENDLEQVVALTHQMKNLQQQVLDMQRRTSKWYLIQDICPYPFDQSIHMIPFPQHCEFQKYDKYNVKTNPIDHVREFRTMILEFSYEETYLMRLFPWSLGEQCLEWFSKLSPPINTFEELVNKFITQYSYNIQHDITMKDLCNLK